MEVVAIFVAVLFILVVGVLLLHVVATPPKKEPAPDIHTSMEFIPSQMYLDSGGGNGIAINEAAKQVCFMRSAEAASRRLPYTDLLAAVVSNNGNVLLHKSRTNPGEIAALARQFESQAIKMAASEANGPSQYHQTQKIDLWIAVRDQEEPIYSVNFLDMEAKEGGMIYEKAVNNAKHWHGLLSELIALADVQSHSVDRANEPQALSPADELTKLSTLLEKQLITKQEFDTQKQKLLAG